MVADWHHFDENQDLDPDPHCSEKRDPALHSSDGRIGNPARIQPGSETLLLILSSQITLNSTHYLGIHKRTLMPQITYTNQRYIEITHDLLLFSIAQGIF
jgi:hypothetical protein